MRKPIRINTVGSANRRPLPRQPFVQLRDGRFVDVSWARHDRVIRAFAARRATTPAPVLAPKEEP